MSEHHKDFQEFLHVVPEYFGTVRIRPNIIKFIHRAPMTRSEIYDPRYKYDIPESPAMRCRNCGHGADHGPDFEGGAVQKCSEPGCR
ncbi:MAG: hypothetical protein MPJ05_08375 [Nitrosopumilus sp.]|nr:hypothetical protein [Nitrosopumilus sp.]